MPTFALVDCNSFYVSCERVFKPHLQNKPVVVLSNNDGCIISRSNEAKALGIKMAEPYFKVKELIQKNKVQVFSSNYTLYGDMSSRVMTVLAECAPELEVYSIDEAFLQLDGFPELKSYVKKIKAKVWQETGIPVSIGVGPTKTLAKLANNIAKKHTRNGVFSLNSAKLRAEYFDQIAIQEVWGIGRRIGKNLREMGVHTVAQFIELDSALVRKCFSVVMLRTQQELKGEPCIELEEVGPDAKCMASTRTFGKEVTTIEDLEASATLHVSRLAQKLRIKNLGVKSFQVFAMNCRFASRAKYKVWSYIVNLPYVTNSTSSLLKAALKGLKNIYHEGVIYKKLGVQAFELLPIGLYKQDLFSEGEDERCSRLSELMDAINSKYGRNQIYHASLGTSRDWLPKDMFRSKHYTTDINDILMVN